jgi:large subunit ribosomal protein L7/L12
MPQMMAPVAVPNVVTSPQVDTVVEKAPEKTEFNLKLESFDAAAKAKVIKEIKNIIPNMNLVEVIALKPLD